MITKKVNKIILSKKLNAMYDYIIELKVSTRDNYITLSDRHGIETMLCEPETTRNNHNQTIIHNIDRRELTKKLKAMSEAFINISFDDVMHEITLQGITNKEKSVYFCISDAATTKEQTFGLFKFRNTE